MRERKDFDCVEMKNAIQARLRDEREDMTDAEIRAEIREKLASSNHPVAAKWRQIIQTRQVSANH